MKYSYSFASAAEENPLRLFYYDIGNFSFAGRDLTPADVVKKSLSLDVKIKE